MKTALYVFFCILTAIRGSHALHGQEYPMHSVPLQTCSGLPCIEATTEDGGKLRLLIDTGDLNTMLDDGSASRIHLQLEAAHGPDGNPVPGYSTATLHGLTIGSQRLNDLRVVVTDLHKTMNNRVPDADGFLTYPAFKDRLLRFDFVRKQFSFSEPLTSPVLCKGKCGVLKYSTFGKHGPRIVLCTGFSVNGKPITAQVDTLYTGSVLIYPHAVAALGLEKESQSLARSFFNYTDGGVEMVRGTAKTISFLDVPIVRESALYFATPQVHTPDALFEATVGVAVFEKFVVTFNFHDNWISLEQPRRANATD
jgi:hypothetical protein